MAMPRSPVDGLVDDDDDIGSNNMTDDSDDGKVDATMLPPG